MVSIVLMSAILGSTTAPAVPRDDAMVAARAYVLVYASRGSAAHRSIPSFARQTGLACSACHTTFPQLSPLGRLFKLNGYTLTGLKVVQAGDSGQRSSLRIDLIPPVSAMVLTSVSRTATAVPGARNTDLVFPQDASLFIAGGLSERMGMFAQISYEGIKGSFAVDNTEIRFVGRTELADKGIIYGLMLNNSPTSQDVWNSAPAWRFPQASSTVAPTPAAATLLDGALAHQVAGLGGYAIWNGAFYAEFSAYRSAPQGGPHPPDQNAANTIQGIASYWRVFWEHIWGDETLMIGSLGLSARLAPPGVTGPVNRYRDVGFDAQYERRLGGSYFSTHGSWIHENRQFDAGVASGASSHAENSLSKVRVDAGILTSSRIGMTVGYFAVTGTADRLLWGGGPISGSVSGTPDSRGVIGELSYMPWLNTRFAMQYVAYDKFNGGSTNYDGAGRNASANNTLYLSAWLVF